MAKYKVGDRVVIRKDLKMYSSYGTKTFVPTMEEMCNAHDYILTIKKICGDVDDAYVMEEDETGCEFSWTDKMIEKFYVDTKFEAFLKEVVDIYSDGDIDAWLKIRNLVEDECGDSKEETIQWLVDFYNNFVPKGELVKRMTKAEIEGELGYSIEIVE